MFHYVALVSDIVLVYHRINGIFICLLLSNWVCFVQIYNILDTNLSVFAPTSVTGCISLALFEKK